jgi:SWI/SNF-related matrix-associated actin-dependent regulator 1 of chromatin subfamily A
MELYEYQKATVDLIQIGADPTYLAYEMGTGKTAIAIETAKRRKVKRLLVLCPAVGKLTWAKELARWWPGVPVTIIETRDHMRYLDHDGVFVMSYSRISSVNNGFDFANAVAQHPKGFAMTVLDEAHHLKNPKAIRTKGVLITMRNKLGFVLPMSGTPAPNHAGELFPILRTIFPETVRKSNGQLMKQYEFEDTYCQVVNKWFSGRSVRTIVGSKNIDVLKARLGKHFLRKTKKQVLPDLPDMTFDTWPVAAPNAPEWNVDWRSMSDDEIEAFFTSGGAHVMKMRHEIGLAKVPEAVQVIAETLDNCRRKVLVFAHHQDVVLGLLHGLAAYGPVVITGATGSADRQRAIDGFLNNPACRVFVGNIQAAGTTITLIGPANECSDVFFVESDFSPGNNVQAASRVHRIGQKDAVQVWFITAHGTYDDRIQEIVSRKARDFHLLFG